MIRRCAEDDFDAVHAIINEAARAYKGVIPSDCWKEPYMPREELRREIEGGVAFWGYDEGGELVGVMGIQHVENVTLVRHAYVRSSRWRRGIGARLLSHLRALTNRPVLIGTWKDASWAIRFYEKHGFRLVSAAEKDPLLRKYWSVPDRQIQNSVVLADEKWFAPRRA